MASVRIVAPLVAIASLIGLAVMGERAKVYNIRPHVVCVIDLIELDVPAPDVLFIGSSRTGRGLDHGYMMQYIAEQTGREIDIERLVLTRTNISQFRIATQHYLESRGAPKDVYLQILYSFAPDLQRTADLPIHNVRSLAIGTMQELWDVQRTAELTPHPTALPRWLEAGYAPISAVWASKFEMNVYSALRWPWKVWYDEHSECEGDRLQKQGTRAWVFNDLADDEEFSLTNRQERNQPRNLRTVANFVPYNPASYERTFENRQLEEFIHTLQDAGSRVHLFLLPILNETELPEGVLNELQEIFSGVEIIHPFSLFQTEIGADLTFSFVDTHHASHYGALHYSRFFANHMIEEMNQ